MFLKLTTLALILITATILSAQVVPEKNATEAEDKLRKEAVAFLRETMADVNSMRSLENRISFTAELASLMWYHDEREARAMYAGIVADFKDLLVRYDSQLSSLDLASAEDPAGLGYGFMTEPSDRMRLLRRFTIAMGVRQQIAKSMAEHDPDLALGFYYDSLSAITNPEFRKGSEARDRYFEISLLSSIADKDLAKAVKYGARSLESGFSNQHVELLRKIYAKDPDKGAEFGSSLVSALKSQKFEPWNLYPVGNLLDFGGESLERSQRAGRRPVLSQSELRDVAEVIAQSILSSDDPSGLGYATRIQKYSPGRAAQIRAKFRDEAWTRGSSNATSRAAANAMNAAANAAYAAAYAANMEGKINSASNTYPTVSDSQMAEQKAFEDLANMEAKKLPKEERDKIVAQARKIVMQKGDRASKVMGLGALASVVAKLGDKELASEIMRDAETFVNPAPKNYRDFVLTWMLASGYAHADPDRAFPLLEDTIGRANDTLAAFVKVGEFMDVAEEMIVDGEVQVGGFGDSMIRGLTKELTMADETINVLARVDFGKTKNLTNRFDRPEIRVLSKMMVLRAVLGPKAVPTPETKIEPEIEEIDGR